MFLAPIALPRDAEIRTAPSTSARASVRSTRAAPPSRGEASRAGPARPIERAAVRNLMLVWLAAGCTVALLFPHWLSSRSAGASVAFWLVGAPLIDLAWLCRARITAAFRRALVSRRPRNQARRWTRGAAR